MMENKKNDPRPYRPCVGMMLINSDKHVFVAKRIDTQGSHWQMPQGGIEDGETPVEAAFRELNEEIGTNNLELIAECPDWFSYDLPFNLSKTVWQGRYRGQKQKWCAFRFLGIDSDIDIQTRSPEFSDWRWAEAQQLPDLIVPFKKDVYERVIRIFQPLLVD